MFKQYIYQVILGSYLLIIPNMLFAVGISTMTGDASLSNTKKNWDPEFIEGNTVVVGKDSVLLTTNTPRRIGAIRLDNRLAELSFFNFNPSTIGSIAGDSKLKMLRIIGSKNDPHALTLTGEAGVNNNPPANDYSGVSHIRFTYDSILNINAPVTIDSTFDTSDHISTIININDDVMITDKSIAKTGNNTTINIARRNSLTLSGNNMNLISAFDFKLSGILNLNGNNISFNPISLSNVENATLNVNNNVTTNTSSVVRINTINIADTKNFTVDSVNGDIFFFTPINLKGSSSTLSLTNSGISNQNFIIYNNLLSDNTEDAYGIIKIDTRTNELSLTSNYNIGKDNTHRIKALILSGSGDIILDSAIFTKQLTINGQNKTTLHQILDLGIDGNILFSSDGTLIANRGIIGDIDFAGNAGTLILADNQTITGNVDSTSSSAGTLEFVGKGTITGTIGATNAITKLKYSGVGENSIPGAVKARTIEIANNSAQITAPEALTGNILFTADGTLVTNKGVRGSITTTTTDTGTISIGGGDVGGVIGSADKKLKQVNLNQAAAANVGAIYAGGINIGGVGPITVTDLITSEVSFGVDGTLIANKGVRGSITTATADTGTISIGSGDVGVIGSTEKKLKQVNLNQAAAANVGAIYAGGINIGGVGPITATELITSEVSFGVDSTLIANKGVRGNIDFAGNAGILTLADNQTITGNVDSTNSSAGTLEFVGKGTITGTIGATNAITKLKYSGVGENSIPGAVKARTIEIANNSAQITAPEVLTGNILFTADGTLIANKGVRGSITTTITDTGTISIGSGDVGGVIGSADKKLKQVNLNQAAAANVGAIYAGGINIGGVGPITVTDLITSEVSFGVDGTLIANKGVRGSITTATADTGTISIGSGDVGVIGSTEKKLKQVNLNQAAAANVGAIYAGGINIGGVGPITATELITSEVSFGVDSTLIANKGVRGNIDFAGNAGILTLADNQTITGNVDSTNSSAGTLEFVGKGTITGTIGATNAITKLKYSGVGENSIPGAVKARTIEIANNSAQITAPEALTGNILFTADGTLIANKGVRGSITTTITDTGTISIGSGDVGGVIGSADKKLKQVNLNQAVAVNVGAIYAGGINIGGVGPITATELITSEVSFGVDGTLIANKGVRGSITTATADTGTISIGSGDVGVIGSTEKKLKQVNLNQAAAANVGAIYAGGINIGGVGPITVTDLITSEVSFGVDGTLIANKGVRGSITTATADTGTISIGSGDVGVIGSTEKKLKQVNLNQAAAANVGAIYAGGINIGGVGPITATELITSEVSFGVDSTLIANKGVRGNIDFAGNAGILTLADNQTITGNVDSTNSSAGTLEFVGKGTITGTIGATNAITKLKYSGVGENSIPGAVKARTIEIANNSAQITAPEVLTGNILFTADGTLIANKGVRGSITTTITDTGTISIGSGDVGGVIGSADKKLKQVNLNQAAAANVGAIYAGGINIGGVGPITVTDLITSEVSFGVDGTLIANKGVRGSITTATADTGTISIGGGDVGGVIGSADKKLKQVNLNQAAAANVGAIYAGGINIGGVGPITATELITSEVSFGVDGTLIANKGVRGSITTATADTGTISIGSGDVGVIGSTEKKLKQVNLNQAAAANVGAIYAGGINIGGVGPITVTDLITSEVSFGVDGTLIANKGVRGSITTATADTGTISIGSGDVGVIGSTEKKLKQVNLNQAAAANVGAIYAGGINIGGVGPITATELITSEVSFGVDSTLIANKGVRGSITTTTTDTGTISIGSGDVGGVIGSADKKLKQVNLNQAVAANVGAIYAGGINIGGVGPITATELITSEVSFGVDGTLIANKGVRGSITTATADTGTISIGGGDIGGVIGSADKKLKQVNLNQAAAANVGAIYAGGINIGGVGPITVTDLITSEVSFGVDGTLIANKGVRGSITTATADTGTISIGSGDVGVIGSTEKKLKQVNLNQAAAANVGAIYAGGINIGGVGPITATELITSEVSFGVDSTLIANKGVRGNIDFAGNAGILTLADNQTITGNVDSTNSSAGTLEFVGKGTITGTIGATNAITKLKYSGVGENSIPGAVKARTIEIANNSAQITAPEVLTGNILFTADGTLIANKGVRGSITTTITDTGTISIGSGDVGGVIGSADKKLKQVNLNQAAAANVGAIYAGGINIGGVGPITVTDLITSEVSFGVDGTLIANKGVRGSITTATADTGTISIGGGDVGGVIGSADKKLKQVNLNQAAAANVGAIYAGGINIGGVGPITATELITSEVSFGVDGTLIANKGVRGSITTATADTGTISIGSGDVGVIGSTEKKLKQVNLNQAAAANVGAIYAGGINIGGVGPITVTDLITSEVSFGVDGTLIANKGVRGSITTATADTGTISIGSGDVGVIGSTEKKLKQVNLNQAAAANVGAIYAGGINIGGVGPITATELITSEVSFGVDSTLIANKGVRGNIDFAGNAGILTLADNQTITGNVDSTNSSAGTLEFVGKGTITGTIGATNAITKLKYSGVGENSIPGAVKARTIEIANNSAQITAPEVLTGNILFTADGTLIANKGVRGNIDFAGNAGILTLADNQTITGNVDSTNSSAGTLEFVGKGTVTGTIGATNSITKLKYSGAGENSIPGAVKAGTIEIANNSAQITAPEALTGNILFTADGTLIANKGVRGNIDFAGNAGILTLADNQTITGNVDSTNSSAGTLEFLGKGTVTGTIGATNSITKLKYSGAGENSMPGAVKAGTIEIANNSAQITAPEALTGNILFTADGTLIANKGVRGNIDFAGNAGILTLADNQTITGNVDSTNSSAGTLEFLGKGTVTGTIGATNSITKLKYSGAGENSMPGAVKAGTIEIANNSAQITAPETLTGNILFTADGTLIANKGVRGNIDFAGNAGILTLADNQTITGNVDSTNSSAGTLEFVGKGTVTGTIGATNAITKLKYSGVGENSIPGAVKARTIEIANNSAQITAPEALTGNILFTADGTLIANKGVRGSITTTTTDTGTISIGSGDVGGVIGSADKKLKQVNLNQAVAVNVGAIYAGGINIGGVGPITATELITSEVSFGVDSTLIVNKGVTGNIDFAGKVGNLICNGDGSNNWYLGGTINNAENALLEVDTKLLVTDKGIGSLKTINIGKGGVLSIESNDANLSLLSSQDSSINFKDEHAQLILSAPLDQTIKFMSSIDGADNGEGKILLDGNGHNLTITSDNDASLGRNDHKLASIDISSNVIFDKSVNVSNVLNLNINSDACLTDYSITSPSISRINIGNTQGAGQYILDSINSDFTFSGDRLTYMHEDSVLALVNTSEDTDRSITLNASIVPSQDKYGILQFHSKNGKLTIDNNNDLSITLGSKEHRLKQITLSSDGYATFYIRPDINVENIALDINNINFNIVNANILFHKNTLYNANGDVNGNINFLGNNGVINIKDSVNLNGDISNTGAASGELNFLGSSAINGIISNISTVRAGAGDIHFLVSGDYSINELQGNGTGTVMFPSNVVFIGGINITGGEPLNLSFADNNTITGDIGSASSPVGNVSSSDNVKFDGDINSIGDINSTGKVTFVGDVTCNNIFTNNVSNYSLFSTNSSNTITNFKGRVSTKGNIEVNGRTYFADTVKSQGSIIINGDASFNKALTSSKNIVISNSSSTTFNDNVNAQGITADNANIVITNNVFMQGDMSVSNSNLDLGGNTLTLEGTTTFSNQIIINGTYNVSNLSGGNIVLASGSTLDLSNVHNLLVKLSFINSDISNIDDGTKYNIILAENGSSIIPLSDPDNQIQLDSSGEHNKFVKWILDPKSLTLYVSDNSNNVIDKDYVLDSQQDKTFIQELKHASLQSDAQKFKNNIGLLSKKQVEDMLSRILDHGKQRDSDIIRVVLQQTLTGTHNSAMLAIHNRLIGAPLITSAGDDDMDQYGVWSKASINHNADKVNGKVSEYFSSYKTRGHSNTIGLDGLVCDDLLLGVAYTNAYTKIKPQNQNIGNVNKARTNVFSLYSSYSGQNYNWFLNSTISYAESSIRQRKIRNLAISKDLVGHEIASSKYKSHLYSGSLSLGYNYHICNDIYISPSLGVMGSVIRDEGYKESGTSFQNLEVRKKNYNKLSSVIGLRAFQNLYLDSVTVTPELYSFINYAFKNKTPAIDAKLNGVEEHLPTIHFRSNRVNYNIGLDILLRYNMMGYGISYNTTVAKKYQGHSGSFKLRVSL
ncbi:hypothetical protein [Rickettsia parkeri]|uniref:hypothetical protein n=1 Tax=Rickettsia parkeri TaxID=35792 RepID=UPI001649B81F|nr:hypothetical protein [Rickettsia parkeri]